MRTRRPLSMLALALALALAGLAQGAGAVEGSAAAAVSRASIDPHLFRDGEVRRRNERHGRWSLDCDEVPRLAQRYCSLRTLALDEQGTALARVTISTDEKGRPATLLDIPLPLDLREPIAISAATALVVGSPSAALLDDARRRANGADPGAKKSGGGKLKTMDVLSASLRPDVCGASSCHVVWTLAPSDVAALRAGAGLRIRFRAPSTALAVAKTGQVVASRLVEGTVSSEGLDAAITASLHD